MVDRTRELEFSLGNGVKKIEDNEKETEVLQRRGIRARVDLPKGHIITRDDLEVLRPCPQDALPPFMMDKVLNKRLTHDLSTGDHVKWTSLEEPS